MKSQLKDHPQRSSFPSQTRSQSPTGFSITSNGNSSPAEFIGGILSRTFLLNRLISSSVYSPMELSSPAGLFSQSSSLVIPSGNEKLNSILQQLRYLFPQLKHHIPIHHDTCIYALYEYNLIILRTSLPDPYHAFHRTDLYLS